MKAPPFDYLRPSSLAEVFVLLEQHGDSARLMAGGQTLLATLNLRLSEPGLLIDLRDVPGLRGISLQQGHVRIGALTTHSEIEDSAVIAQYVPLLSMAAPHVAHRAIRNRGTIGGALAHADPAAEWPACAVALNATLMLQSKRGFRRVKALDFFQNLYTTALDADEIIVACEFPIADQNLRYTFDELARRRGDYAIVGLAATAQQANGVLRGIRLVFLGTGNIPMLALNSAAALENSKGEAQYVTAALTALAGELIPAADLHNDTKTKLHLAGVLLRRSVAKLSS